MDFYDIYNNKQNLSQFVSSIEILNSNVEIRTNFYKPSDNEFMYSGIEGELAEGVHIKGLYLDGSNIEGNHGVINNANNANHIKIDQSTINSPHTGIHADKTSNSVFQGNNITTTDKGITYR